MTGTLCELSCASVFFCDFYTKKINHLNQANNLTWKIVVIFESRFITGLFHKNVYSLTSRTSPYGKLLPSKLFQYICRSYIDRQTNRWTDRQTERPTRLETYIVLLH